MSRFTLEEFESRNPTLVYIAGNVVDAEIAERALTECGIDYALNIEPYAGTSFLSGVQQGLFVYVSQEAAAVGRQCLERKGLKDTIDLHELEDRG